MSSEEVKKQITELESLRSQAQKWRIFTVLAVLFILAGGVGVLINAAAGLVQSGRPEQEVFVSQLREGIQKEIVPTVERIGKDTLRQITPKVEAEFKKLNARAPEIGNAFLKELDKLNNNLREEGTKVVLDTVGEALHRREANLRKTYPEITEARVSAFATALVDNSHEHLHDLSDRLFGAHIKSIASITENLQVIQRSEKINASDDLPTWEMAMLVVDLAREETKDFHTEEPGKKAEPAAKPAATAAKEGK